MNVPPSPRAEPYPTRQGVETLLADVESVILLSQVSEATPPVSHPANEQVYAGVDLGTAYLVLVVLDEELRPLAGEYQYAEVVRDGLVLDFAGTVDRLREMKHRIEYRIGRPLTQAGSGYPPGVPSAEVRAVANVLEAADLRCVNLVDEPSAANAVLGLDSGAIVDVGGGTTGIAILEGGQVIYSADEATGGTHFTLVIAGGRGISFAEAELLKTNPTEQTGLFPMVRPVMEKVGSIVNRHLDGRSVDQIALVGGSAAFPGFAEVIEEYTGIPTWIPERPLFVTPLGIAMNARVPVHVE